MTVTTSYPGVYIQELPSLVHTIQPAPTSITVFVGYTNPFFVTPALPAQSDGDAGQFGTAIQLFSFADYQTYCGGFFSSPWLPDYMGQAVYQFFLNGGQTCYVVALLASNYYDPADPDTSVATVAPATAVFPPTATSSDPSITFKALQPVANTPPSAAPAASGTAAAPDTTAAPDKTTAPAASAGDAASPAAAASVVGIPMQVQFSNYKSAPSGSPETDSTADIMITYGTMVETYRQVGVANLQTTTSLRNGPVAANSPPPMLQNSALVEVTVSGSPTLSEIFPAPPTTTAATKTPATKTAATTAATTTASTATAASGPVAQTLIYPSGSEPTQGWIATNPSDFEPVFQEYASLDKVPIFNLLATPGMTNYVITSEAAAYCEIKRAFYIMDTPSPDATNWGPNSLAWDAKSVVQAISSGSWSPSDDFPVSTNAALYYPWLATTDPTTGAASFAPPSGFVAGMYGQEDNNRGVWKSPAGIETSLLGTTGVHPDGVMTDPQQGVLNQSALDCIRQFPGIGTVIFGARTTAGADANTAQQQWKYVAVRRMALFIEQTLYANLKWAVFEGNSTPLWKALTQEVTAFMLTLFRQGAFAGDTPSQAFLVQCDSTTTTAQDISNGIVNILVGFAPLVPAEFVVVQIAQLAGQAQS